MPVFPELHPVPTNHATLRICVLFPHCPASQSGKVLAWTRTTKCRPSFWKRRTVHPGKCEYHLGIPVPSDDTHLAPTVFRTQRKSQTQNVSEERGLWSHPSNPVTDEDVHLQRLKSQGHPESERPRAASWGPGFQATDLPHPEQLRGTYISLFSAQPGACAAGNST